MVSPGAEAQANPTSSSSSLHYFLVSDPISSQTQFENPHFSPYGSDVHPRAFSNQPLSASQFPSMQSLEERMSRSVNLVSHEPPAVASDHGQPDMGHTRHFMDLLRAQDGPKHGPSRLSLSLGSQVLHPPGSLHYRQSAPGLVLMNQAYGSLVASSSAGEACAPVDCSFVGSNSSFSPYVVGNSGYLKAAQSLLQELIDLGSDEIDLSDAKRMFLGSRGISSELRAEILSSGFLSADKQELQLKLSKLISLLEQVEGKFDEYCVRMEEIISSFEVIAGEGAAKCYTALALQAMSRHFCSLRDAIIHQIKLARKRLCPELPKIGSGLSKLSLFDREARSCNSRMTLQQIGLLQGAQRQAWRPIRGLPETSVAILRAWLFEHFLHPYPNDSEKLTLASQTGLTKNQVSNWFINARVRLWKPMIEEMYKEEFGDSSVDSSGEGLKDGADE